MKNFTQNFIRLFVTVFIMSTILNAQGTHIISASPYNIFIPIYLEVYPGDTIRFEYMGGGQPHTTTSTNIPSGAISWDAELSSSNPSFDLILNIVGTYDYVCTPHIDMDMVGQISVLPTPALDIIGNWVVDLIDAYVTTPPIPQEDIDLLMIMVESGLLTAEEFMEMMGFPIPTTPEEWDALATNGITMPIPNDEIGISGFSFTENQMGLFAQDMILLNYSWSSDSTISIQPSEDLPFTEFTIVSATIDNLNMSSSVTITEEDEGEEVEYTYNIVFYCSSAEELIPGCTSPSAINFDPEANVDDGSCISSTLPTYGCTDETAFNYNPMATIDDGSCIPIIEGCTSPDAFNYDMDANTDDGSCEFAGIEGCTDTTACNFNPNAELFDGSCIYAEMYYDCTGNCINDIDLDGECDEIDYDDGIGIDEVEDQTPQLIKMIDVLGREQKEHKKGMLLFYVYDNGKVEKRIIN